ncbi:MAG: hypothetical protein EOP82_06585 [Variovorax sp.]|nr:MAG: hypothetical protein EOP82_06585 [Variovorax sp.]
MKTPTPAPPTGTDEPEIAQEEDIPSDGTDHAAREMMKEVRNDRLSVPPGEEEDAVEPPQP